MIDSLVVDLSRIQFAATALYHFLFVPLTLGMTFFIAAVETVYVITRNPIYKQMAQFWGKLFLINFALGVATGLTMEFEFGTNWSYYSTFVGDAFGAPLAVEGLMAFFLESTFIGIMLFGWERLRPGVHLTVTYLVALGSNLSALWILVANGFMQVPRGMAFNPVTMRMEMNSFLDLFFNPESQAKFVHTSIAGYVTAAIFVAGISAWYMARGKHVELARRSFRIATVFGVLSTLAVITLGDALGYVGGKSQPTKLAAMEALWKPEQAPMPFNVIAFPSQAEQANHGTVQIPAVLSLLVAHSFDGTVPSVQEIETTNVGRVRNGILAARALKVLQANPADAQAKADFQAYRADLGFGFLVQRYAPDLQNVTEAQIEQAAKDSIPPVAPIFWSFRVMVLCALAMLVFFVAAMIYSVRNNIQHKTWLLKLAPWMIPVPFIACEAGWLVAELGRQPWTLYETLPTWMSASTHSLGYMVFSLIGFVALYTIFIIIEMYLMVRAAKQGPGHDEPSDSVFTKFLPGYAALAKADKQEG